MMVFPGMLVGAAKEAGMKCPEDGEMRNFTFEDYPHFTIFCNVQLCVPIHNWGGHFDNAKVIAQIPEEQLKTITMDQLTELGVYV